MPAWLRAGDGRRAARLMPRRRPLGNGPGAASPDVGSVASRIGVLTRGILPPGRRARAGAHRRAPRGVPPQLDWLRRPVLLSRPLAYSAASEVAHGQVGPDPVEDRSSQEE